MDLCNFKIRNYVTTLTHRKLIENYPTDADIRTDDETFRVPEDESMSASLAARLEELSFAEERILQTIKLERGHGGSIGLQVTEGNDGGVYVQAVSVGGSADMAGNVNKGRYRFSSRFVLNCINSTKFIGRRRSYRGDKWTEFITFAVRGRSEDAAELVRYDRAGPLPANFPEKRDLQAESRATRGK